MAATPNYYKFAIHTSDGNQMSNVFEYQGLFLGKIMNQDRPENPRATKRKRTFALIQYSDTGRPQTLWQGEITNFYPGYNLEIFSHPESPGDYLIFTHPESNLAGSHCYWLQQQAGTSTEISAAETKLRGLKYIHYYDGKFIGVFHTQTTQREHLGNQHRITIGRITFSFRGKQGQLLQRGKQIDVGIINIRNFTDLDPIHQVCSRFNSYLLPSENCLVFHLNLAVQVKYNILTQETTVINNQIEFQQPDGSLLQGWDDLDMPPNPIYNCLLSYTIQGTQDLFVYDTWTWGDSNIYIYKQSDKRFHRIAGPDDRHIGYSDVKFLTPNLAIIAKNSTLRDEYAQFLTQFDFEKLTLTIIRELPLNNCQTISVMPSGSILMRDSLFEPIRVAQTSRPDQPPTLAEQTITRVANALSSTTATMSVPYQIMELIGKFVLARSSRAVATLND